MIPWHRRDQAARRVHPGRTPALTAYPGTVTESLRRQARSFGSAAERYDRYRPGYAREAVVWAVGERPLRIADLGAGTGILSRLLRRLGHEVIAVEPDDQMRAR